jgi:hypothetical protein
MDQGDRPWPKLWDERAHIEKSVAAATAKDRFMKPPMQCDAVYLMIPWKSQHFHVRKIYKGVVFG